MQNLQNCFRKSKYEKVCYKVWKQYEVIHEIVVKVWNIIKYEIRECEIHENWNKKMKCKSTSMTVLQSHGILNLWKMKLLWMYEIY